MKHPRLWARRGGFLQGQTNAELALVLLSDPPHYELVVAAMALRLWSITNDKLFHAAKDVRDDLIATPPLDAKDCFLMSPPNDPRPHDGEVPEHNPALGIARREALVMSHESGGMDLGLMPS